MNALWVICECLRQRRKGGESETLDLLPHPPIRTCETGVTAAIVSAFGEEENSFTGS